MTNSELFDLMCTDRAGDAVEALIEDLFASELSGEECAYVIARVFGAMCTGLARKHGEEALELLGDIAKAGASDAATAAVELDAERRKEAN